MQAGGRRVHGLEIVEGSEGFEGFGPGAEAGAGTVQGGDVDGVAVSSAVEDGGRVGLRFDDGGRILQWRGCPAFGCAGSERGGHAVGAIEK